jgi:hypothetical protein
MCSYCRKHDITEVPDPYYGGPAGFDKVNKKRVPTSHSIRLWEMLSQDQDILSLHEQPFFYFLENASAICAILTRFFW